MADRMFVLPPRAVSASAARAVTEAPSSVATEPMPRHGLHLVKGERGTVAPPPPRAGQQAGLHAGQRAGERAWQTRAIVAQVEREVAAMAARRSAEFSGRIAVEVPRPERRDTPWSVIARIVRQLRPSLGHSLRSR